MNKIIVFFNEVKSELKKMTWPNREELVGSVIVVCILVFVFAAILGAMDGAFGYFIRNFITV